MVPLLVTVPLFVAAGPSAAEADDDSGEGWAVAADPPAAVRTSERAAVRIEGRGYGHGIGMSQYGAQGAARKGLSYRQIVRFYYPNTKLAVNRGFLRVLLTADTTDTVIVRRARGLTVRDSADNKAFKLPARKGVREWRIVPAVGKPAKSAVQYRDSNGWHRWRVPGRRLLRGDGTFRRPGPLRLIMPDGSTQAYRGALRSASPSPSSHTRDTVNVLRLQNYLKGVVPVEMPSYWSQPALRAQAVAARSYALNLKRRDGHAHYDVCDTTSCQVYGGYRVETDATNAAVKATSGETVEYKGKPALTMFSSSSGGWTAWGGLPYLRAHRDRYDRWAGNPMRSWKARVSRSTLERAYPALGRLKAVRVVKRNGHGAWNGRAQRVALRGTGTTVRLSGSDFRSLLGLRSDWVRIKR
ncbi:SpoIID/LytB domain-containing protein [Solicola gregarius]|uniref:SpoIID/LytB domain-containing protein n=1 Tax=Solicola gregarius TaxID=2908642 RepID=A0AA46YJZ1_9ACTN|nr:SpoIID/LytB domain-containing protein [Solicola gregarius]UYM03986.1 SpoIID/LytB domain-containing protein [Solicola gregarius]